MIKKRWLCWAHIVSAKHMVIVFLCVEGWGSRGLAKEGASGGSLSSPHRTLRLIYPESSNCLTMSSHLLLEPQLARRTWRSEQERCKRLCLQAHPELLCSFCWRAVDPCLHSCCPPSHRCLYDWSWPQPNRQPFGAMARYLWVR